MQRYLTIFSCGFMTALVSGCPDGDKGTLDSDGDGYDIDDDCDDNDDHVNPGMYEVCGDGIDNDCVGGDVACFVDNDGDGFTTDDDCDDNDANVNPDALEDCTTGDVNCDGFALTCLYPELTYEPTNAQVYDAYGVGVFADRVVFGDPSGGGPTPVGDGRAVFFDFNPSGDVSELDADLVSGGEVGAETGYGTVITPVGPDLCVGADYHDSGTGTDVGKSWCYSEATVRAAVGTLSLADAEYTTAGEATWDYATTEGQADLDGDGFVDLLVYTSHGAHLILGDGSGWSGDYLVPRDADLMLGDCASSSTGWCGFARALNPVGLASFAISEEAGASEVSIFAGGSTTPTALSGVEREVADAATGITTLPGFAFGNSGANAVTFLDEAGNIVGELDGPHNTMFGYWTSTMFNQDADELLLVSAPDAVSPNPGDNAVGLIYVFNLSANGLPSEYAEAEFILLPPYDFAGCGWRVRGGIVTDESGSYTTVASSCLGYGGAAYRLDDHPLPPPPLAAMDVYTGPVAGEYRIRQWVVDAFTSNLDWLNGLAQTEVIQNLQGNVVGWRLHAIATGSPLHRAGLRNGDLVRSVNGTSTTTPAVINALYSALKDDNELTLGITRAGVNRQLHYVIVP